jgi:hypothetical protein
MRALVADEEKVGSVWSGEELDLIVADYFAMLSAEREGRPYVKAHHATSLMAATGRTHRSVEFKHMNISAVLQELGSPTIRGYKPKANYQGAIFDAIDRFLAANAALLEPTIGELLGVEEATAIFEEPPPRLQDRRNARPERLERLVRKFDPVERDFRNRALGKAGEAAILDLEQERLRRAERQDLARRVRWVSQEDGDGAGYDILSFDAHGQERLIEVKTTRGQAVTPFFLTRNELSLAQERPDHFRLYRVYEFGPRPRLFTLQPPLEEHVRLAAETYRASF